MKLCNYRWPRNSEGRCKLRVNEISGYEWSYLSPFVFAPEGELPTRYLTKSYICTEKMSLVCPYRIHEPIPKRVPTKWFDCPYCKKRHRTEQQIIICKGYHEWYAKLNDFKKNLSLKQYDPEGTREQIYPDDVIRFPGFQNVRAHIWPWMANAIKQRDKGLCQDCGTGSGYFEVHHIIPRALGGSDHPANLKYVCKDCHQKYNEQFNGIIIRQKAIERKTKKLRVSKLSSYGGDES